MNAAPPLSHTPTSRRHVIRLLGGGVVLAAGTAASGCSTALPDAAVLPWQRASAESDTRRFMLAHALLAPNPHNRQPWIADLTEPGRIHLVCDGERLLPETDPFGRQILVGCGAFVELAVMAAAQRGLAVSVAAFPRGVPAATALPRGTHVATPGKPRMPTTGRCLTPRTWLESARLMRIGPQAITTHRDGISLNAAMPRLMHAVGLFDPMEVPQRDARSLQRVMDRWAPFETGSGYLWLAGDDNSRVTQLAAGRAYVRLHLQATAANADMHPLSQALQEFPEVRAPYEALHRVLGVDPARGPVQMLARVGYALAPTGPSPRRELASMLRA